VLRISMLYVGQLVKFSWLPATHKKNASAFQISKLYCILEKIVKWAKEITKWRFEPKLQVAQD
jgi:hypothetical protein